MSSERLDLGDAVASLTEALTLIKQLNGMTLPADLTTREGGRTVAPLRRQLLFVQHLCNQAAVDVTAAYHYQLSPESYLEEGGK